MPKIRHLVSGFVKALKRGSKKPPTIQIEIKAPPIPSSPSEPGRPPIAELLNQKPFSTTLYVDKLSNTVIRVKIPEKNYEKICEALIQSGELVRDVKKIFLFHNLANKPRLQYDDNGNAYWDILIHTQNHDKQIAIIEMIQSKSNLFKLATTSIDHITPMPKLHPEKKGGPQAQTPQTQATAAAGKPMTEQHKPALTQTTKATATPATKSEAAPAEKKEPAPAAPAAEKKEAAPAAPKPEAAQAALAEKKEPTPAAPIAEKKETAPAAPKPEATQTAPAEKKEPVSATPIAEKKETTPAAPKPEATQAPAEKKEPTPAAPIAEKKEAAPAAPKPEAAQATPAEKKEPTPAAPIAEKKETAPVVPTPEAAQTAPAEKKEPAPVAPIAEKKEAAPAAPKPEAAQATPAEKKEPVSAAPIAEKKETAPVVPKPEAAQATPAEKKAATPSTIEETKATGEVQAVEPSATATQAPVVMTQAEIQAAAAAKQRSERDAQLRQKYEEFTEKLKGLFPEGTVTINIKDKEEEIQLGFGTNAKLCEIVRKNLEDYKKIDKIDVGNNFTLPRIPKTTLLFNDDRQEIWREAFRKIALGEDSTKTATKSPAVTIKRKSRTSQKMGEHLKATTDTKTFKTDLTNPLHLKSKAEKMSASSSAKPADDSTGK